MEELSVFQGDKAVGRLWLQRQGMYYLVRCQVRLCEKGRWRLWLSNGKWERPLGLLVPEGAGYSASARIPARDLSVNACRFSIREDGQKRKVEIVENGPLAHISKLPFSRLCQEKGRWYLVFRESQESSKPTGQ